jgi:hypothetical protein
MRKNLLAFSLVFIGLGTASTASSQNIFSGEPVQVVGGFNGYTTTPYGSDYRTTTFRRVSTTTGTPTDGRGQWATTINVAASGGDVMPINMPGGGGNGFLFISGPAANRFANKWVFSNIGQGAIQSTNIITAFNSGNDMGFNMTTPGHYTFVLNDAGYTQTNAVYYAGRTTNVPVNVTRTSQTVSNVNNTCTIIITPSATPSTEEIIYVRYTTGADFASSGSSSLIKAVLDGATYKAVIPTLPPSTVVRYYVFTSTIDEANLTTEFDRSLATLRVDDNSGANYTYTTFAVLPVNFLGLNAFLQNQTVQLKWATAAESNMSGYSVEKSTDGTQFAEIGFVRANNNNANDYSWVDNAANTSSNFYRIVSIDKNGQKTYSKIVKILVGKNNSLGIFPNPAVDNVTIRLSAANKGRNELAIYNSIGQKIYNEVFVADVNATAKSVQLPVGMSKGYYVMVLTNNNEVVGKETLIKQ